MDSDVAIDEHAAGGITVAQVDRNGVSSSRASVISYIHAVLDFGLIVQLSRATEFGGVAIDGEIPNSGIRQADTGSGIAKGKIVGAGAVIGLARVKLEGDAITVAVDRDMAIDLGGHHDSRIVEFRAR